jgi:ABC-type transporter Mla subunit MlaD
MQVLRNEVRTGLLVLATIGLVVAMVLYLSSPGLFKPLKTFNIYFDNAAGIKPGATVMLAGRKIGTVSNIRSPVPLNERPPGRPRYEALISVQVSHDAQIFRETTVSMRTFGLLAELVIDFTSGNPLSGEAEGNDSFVGVRAPDLGEFGPQVIERLDPALKEAERTLAELRRTSQNLTQLTADDSPLVGTVKNFQAVGANLEGMTREGGAVDVSLAKLRETLANVENVTQQLGKDNNIEKTLANFNTSSERLKAILADVDGTLESTLPRFGLIITDLGELTDRLKRQPWRIVWPTTIKYGQQGQGDGVERPPKPEPPRTRPVKKRREVAGGGGS